MSIRRWDYILNSDEYSSYVTMEERDDGDYVLYTDHAAEVERLTAERDLAVARAQGLNHIVDYIKERLGLPEDGFEDDVPQGVDALWKERDAAVALNRKMKDALIKVAELHDFDCHLRHKIVREALSPDKPQYAALAAAPDHIGEATEMVAHDKPHYAALSPEPWGGPEGEE